MSIQDLAQLVAALGGGALLPPIGKLVWRWLRGSADRETSRIASLEQLVDALRRALDKGRLREDALAQVLGVLIFGLRQIEELSPALADALERAIEILEKAQDQLRNISNGDVA